jgi:hypothetical protein
MERGLRESYEQADVALEALEEPRVMVPREVGKTERLGRCRAVRFRTVNERVRFAQGIHQVVAGFGCGAGASSLSTCFALRLAKR